MLGRLVLATALGLASVASACSLPEPGPEAGDSLDPRDVEWLSHAPNRTLVDPAALRAAFDRLHDQLEGVFPGVSTTPPSPSIDRAFVPSGWGEARDVTVLVGATQSQELPEAADRCDYLRVVAGELAELGWRLRAVSTEAIQTTYPLVSPGPLVHTLTGESSVGSLSVVAPPDGDYRLTFGLDGSHLDLDAPVSTPVEPPDLTCG